MRLDKFLKVSRIIKRRTIANEYCDAGRVEINGKVVKASYDVKPDDKLTVRFGEKSMTVKVVSVNEYATKETASQMYEIVNE
ncbi:MAG: RNA-binding S4 domain-containing protein [Clostridia bacterium]|nr:RNA-binding S4 domain-containing protein [Clostridia bacterium]